MSYLGFVRSIRSAPKECILGPGLKDNRLDIHDLSTLDSVLQSTKH